MYQLEILKKVLILPFEILVVVKYDFCMILFVGQGESSREIILTIFTVELEILSLEYF